jgi:ASC-1-like (ASCH) protein
MSANPPTGSRRPATYGSAKDLPSYQELSQQIQGGKLLTLVIARDQRKKLIEIEEQIERLTRIVDDFYERLGSRNWIFHDLLSVNKVEQLLAETTDAETAEERLIELYRDQESTKWWIMRLRTHDGLRQRLHQIERACEHYNAGHFDSCVLQLIAVMDGFVNDFEPGERKGLHSRDPDDMAAWDSVVGHHMGLTHAMATFTKTIKKRVDDEVFEVYRHGIMHGSIVNFDNVVVATKGWNMLFAVADWATATRQAAEPRELPPSWSGIWTTLTRQAAYKRYEQEFVPSTLEASDPGFTSNEIVVLASEFVDAWEHRRWGIVARFTPPILRGSKSVGQAASHAKDIFEQYNLKDWSIESMTYDQASTATIKAKAMVHGQVTELRFRMVFWTVDGNVGIPDLDEGSWSLAVWAPNTYLQ